MSSKDDGVSKIRLTFFLRLGILHVLFLFMQPTEVFHRLRYFFTRLHHFLYPHPPLLVDTYPYSPFQTNPLKTRLTAPVPTPPLTSSTSPVIHVSGTPSLTTSSGSRLKEGRKDPRNDLAQRSGKHHPLPEDRLETGYSMSTFTVSDGGPDRCVRRLYQKRQEVTEDRRPTYGGESFRESSVLNFYLLGGSRRREFPRGRDGDWT